ncbi:mitogen-activated protein kinase kinase kinase 18-like [Mercurialis annua]|uniref:mitogen-activated protein kinase kinase kinase 18-like n=1 Tax=Mercurialis annua TaxID=3986 RepID=UPI00215F13F7|nr:mitogen-activated protein kinase kinase kinase 18-like [Mercurialis annua]
MEWTRGPVIGRGSTATVSLATSTFSGEVFALKSSELSKSKSLQREQFLLSSLSSCPYVVHYIGYDITTENSRSMYNICMEYIPGGTLHDEILRHGGRLNEDMIKSYTRNILQGLDYLHMNIKLVHCDIKSKNILISKDVAKIADFGCAKFDDDTSEFSGTPAFMSPEVARGEEQGFPADIWAVGCTVIEMATGSIPWVQENNHDVDPLAILYKIGYSGEIPEFPTLLSESCKDFLNKCFIKDSKKRWTAKELLGHPFLDQFDDHKVRMSSPSCVLDQDFWNSMDAFENHKDSTVQIEDFSSSSSSSGNSPGDQRLSSLISDGPSWDSEENWITVRISNEIEEKDLILMDEDLDLDLDEFLVSDSIIDEQMLENFIFDEVEGIIRGSDNVSSSSSERFDVKNVNFEMDNENSCFVLNFNLLF